MKCEHCGKNEVTFVCRTNDNGKVEETHLCQECAEKLGYTRAVAAHSQRMLQNFFGGGSGFFGDSFFGDFLTPMSGWMGRMLEDPFDDFFEGMPALRAAPAGEEPQKEEKKADLVDEKEQSVFAYQRKVNALRLEMRKAVHQENFERAAQVRDELRKLEAEHKEAKNNKESA